MKLHSFATTSISEPEMRINYILLIITLLVVSACNSKSDKKQAVKEPVASNSRSMKAATEQDLAPFLLKNHMILDFKNGDLNNDNLTDVILIQKAKDEEQTSSVTEHPTPRPVMLLLRQKDGSLKLAARNDKLVYCVDCGGVFGDPYEGISIKGNYFSIEHYGGSAWRWSKIITFRYDKATKNWLLHKDGGVSYHSAEPETTTTTKVQTVKDFGIVKFTDYDIYKEWEEAETNAE